MFIFNPRKGTPAAEMEGQIPEEIKVERIQRLIQLQHRISKESNQRDIGKTYEVLVEEIGKYQGQLLGRTAHNKMIAFEGSRTYR